jgi:hypothetical protein
VGAAAELQRLQLATEEQEGTAVAMDAAVAAVAQLKEAGAAETAETECQAL